MIQAPNRSGDTRTQANDLAMLGHFLNGGRPLAGHGLRALLAGGGTGDATVHLARQLAAVDPRAEVVHIDLSEASLAIAQARIEALGLTNVTFAKFSLLDLTPETFGLFDYLNCSGVLHHLPDPIAGLRALRDVLRPEGAMSIMLYGAYGRIGVYQVQDLLLRLGRAEADQLDDLIGLTRRLLAGLPPSHWLVKKTGLRPDQGAPTAEIVDKYLHPHDRPFTVPQIFEAVDAVGLTFVSFLRGLWYDPVYCVNDPTVRARLDTLPERERAAFAEILHGAFHDRHVFYLSRRDSLPPRPSPRDEQMIPVWLGPTLPPTQQRAGFGGPIPLQLGGAELRLVQAIDGATPLAPLREQLVAAGVFARDAAFDAAWERLYWPLHGRGLLMLRAAAP